MWAIDPVSAYNIAFSFTMCKYFAYVSEFFFADFYKSVQLNTFNTLLKGDPHADVWTFGFPCQDLSIAGKQKGFRFICKDCGEEWEFDNEKHKEQIRCPRCGSVHYQAASRSGMFFEMMRLLDETKKNIPEQMPKALFIENVKGLKPYIPVLEYELKKRGYLAYIQLYNSKYWGVPQSRERYFIVGLPEEFSGFSFPEEQHMFVPKLSSILDKNVDEKYYIADEKAATIISQALNRLDKLGTVHATLTPDRLVKRQNGPRAKEEEKEMFTITAQDVHGVIICEEKPPVNFMNGEKTDERNANDRKAGY